MYKVTAPVAGVGAGAVAPASRSRAAAGSASAGAAATVEATKAAVPLGEKPRGAEAGGGQGVGSETTPDIARMTGAETPAVGADRPAEVGKKRAGSTIPAEPKFDGAADEEADGVVEQRAERAAKRGRSSQRRSSGTLW